MHYSKLRARLDAKIKVVERMKARIAHLTEVNGVQIGSMSSDFSAVMTEMTETVHNQYPKDSFQRLFWDEQIRALKKSDSTQIRWHPAMIKWCLHLKFISSGAYHALRNSGVITLPSERTLRDYTNWIRAGVGFHSAVDDQLVQEMHISEERHRYIALCWDEMKIKEGLVFNKYTCELVGFQSVGDINNDLEKLQQECHQDRQFHPSRDVASHMLVFMIRGLFNAVNFPYAQFSKCFS